VRNSCHFGAAGYYANMAAQEGLVGIAMSNADPNMAIPNSSGVAIGNNPFSFAIPYKDGKTIFLDMALSNVAALKVVMAREKGIDGSFQKEKNRSPRPFELSCTRFNPSFSECSGKLLVEKNKIMSKKFFHILKMSYNCIRKR
jgi:hypothetical protein